jgi:hypothetical protein
MKITILAFLLCCGAFFQTRAADEPLIPLPSNAVVSKIHSGMSIHEVEAVLSTSYPKVAGHMGNWSGQTGYIDYKLDDRFTLSVSSITRDGKEVVHDEILMYLFDWSAKRRVDIKILDWDKQPPKTPSPNAPAPEADCERLYLAWKQECVPVSYSSNSRTYTALPSYRKIVAIGKPALPFLEHKMQGDEDWMLAYAAAEICGWDERSLGASSGQDYRDKVLKRLRETK